MCFAIRPVVTHREQTLVGIKVDAVGIGSEMRQAQTTRRNDHADIAAVGREPDQIQGNPDAAKLTGILLAHPSIATSRDNAGAVWRKDDVSVERRYARELLRWSARCASLPDRAFAVVIPGDVGDPLAV